MAVVFALLFISQLVTSILTNSLAPKTYKAAILEHDIRHYVNSPLETMLANVKVYTETAAKAALEGVDILAFPEYGIVTLNSPSYLGTNYTSEDFFVYLSPEAVGNWVPCESPEKFGDGRDNQKLLELLSCAALNNSIVLVVNLLTKEPCSKPNDVNCFPSGFRKFNTNLIFNKNGTLLARYHKHHLFEERVMTPGPKDEYEIIDVGFMKFGTFICFDALYGDPLVDYVTKHGIRNLIFTTAWVDELPFHSSPQVYNRMARGLGINLIVSNAYYPNIGRLGSGIYSSINGAAIETYDLSTPGRLLIAELPIDPPVLPTEASFECPLKAENQSLSKESNRTFYIHTIGSNIPSSSPSEAIHQIWFQGLRNFSHIFLESKEESVSLCENDLCCHLSYSFAQNPGKDLYTFAINNAYRMFGSYKFYEQVCSVMRCESKDIETCGRVPAESTSAIFNSLTLTGSFATTTLFPSILATDLQSIPDSEWDFSQGNCTEQKDGMKYGGRITLKSTASKPIMVASIYSRVYDRD
uniref:Vascular non-inflammatory molecule 3 n=1 Tax=Hemiscolopendra marginata TaxID=943146 RepID=A0A646QDD1_9MYRI